MRKSQDQDCRRKPAHLKTRRSVSFLDSSIGWSFLTRRDEADVLEPHTINAHYVAAILFFVVFGDNVVRWIEGGETYHWFWLLSGKGEAVAVFGALSVLARFQYW